ncbi:MAG: diguanylate cyclase [Solirubrobacterales bacterium]|nr:diguanylate cyclase [Solirubrobacterales bacterium]
MTAAPSQAGSPDATEDRDAGPILKGGYMLHSPQSRMAAAKMSMGYMAATVVIIVALAIESGHFSILTAGLLLASVTGFAILRRARWDRVSLVRLTWVYWGNILMFVAIAVDFSSPAVLLGIYPSLLVLTDAWWFRRSVRVLSLAIGFGIFTAVSFAIAGGAALGDAMIEAPLMIASIVLLASISNNFVATLLHRQHLGGTVMSLMHALHARDGYAAGHSADALAMALAVGDRLDLSEEQLNELADVALMHDIGKIGIPNAILQKPDSLDEDEWVTMREHPAIGARIVGDVPGFEKIARAIGHSHERWDGAGYPASLAGDDIPITSRIVLVCDAYLAMTSDRPYRSAMSPELAREELARNAGTQFDPAIVPEFLAALDHGIDEHSQRLIGHRSSMTSLVAKSLAGESPKRTSQDDVETRSIIPVDALYGDDPDQDDSERLSRHNATIDDGLMRSISMRIGLLSAAVAATYFAVFDHIDMGSALFVGWFLTSIVFSFALDRTRFAEPWYFLLTFGTFVIAPLTASHFDQPAMLLFVLLPATAGMRHFWDRRAIRFAQIAALVVTFGLMPILIFGMAEFPMAIVGLRAFPATIILVGFLTERLWKVRFERGRFVSTVRSLLAALQARDGYTGDHSEETLKMVMGVADQLGLDEHERNELADVALLHDVGKIGIPDSILNKPGKLDKQEWRVMKQHPQIGEEIVSKVPGFEDVAKAIRHEHERWDGTGYPDKIAGDDIPLASRIVLVCDAYHAMMSDRPYRKALGLEVARDELLKHAGSQFDPRVVNALLSAIDNRTGEVVVGLPPIESSADDSEYEIDHDGFEGIGMSPKAGWYASALLYGAGGLSYLLIAFGTDVPMSRSIGVLATIAALSSIVWLIGARVATNAKWGPHVRISFGILLIGGVAFEIGAPVGMITPLMMFPVLASAFLHTPRVAVPYCMAGALVAAAAVLAAPAPSTGTYVLVTFIAFSSIALAAIYAQYQLRTMAEMNHRLSTTDALTGCANVRRLRSRLKQDLIGAAGQYRIALYAIDLDDFKQVNDRFSHTRGDELLKAVANELAGELESSDLLVRRGGDEFVVVVAISAGRNLGDLRTRLTGAVRRAREEVCPQVNPNASVGYVIHRDGESADEMLLRADEALHMAKLDAHPDRRSGDETVRNLAAYRRSIAVRPNERSESAIADEAEEVRIARWVNRALGTHTAWVVATWTAVVMATTFAIAAMSGLATQLRSPVAIVLIAAIAAIAPLTYWASRRELATPWLHGFVVLIFALLTAVIAASGSASPDFVDFYVYPTLFACYFLSAKRAAVYLGLAAVLYAAALYSSAYPFTTAKVLMGYLVTALIGVMLAKARVSTLAFASRAVETSVVDPLTGAANLRGLRQRVADELDRSELTGKYVAVLGIDIDDFKSVNDTYSHALGDSVLRATVEATRKCVRVDELVARRGGDEFAAVCAVSERRDAEVIAGRIRETITRARSDLCPDLLATASVAVTIRQPDEPVDAFLARVDEDLHDEKQRSRSSREPILMTA